jgi:hypothetical protein
VITIVAAVLGPVIGIVLAGLVGNKVAFQWDVRKRRTELDLDSLHGFYKLYGEFFALLKLWDCYKRRADGKPTEPAVLDRFLVRATDSEGRLEALLLKVSSERELGEAERDLFGAFRQGYQTLRESAREDLPVNWTGSNFAPYAAFKELASAISQLLSSDANCRWEAIRSPESIESFRVITSNVYEFPGEPKTVEHKPWPEVAQSRVRAS